MTADNPGGSPTLANLWTASLVHHSEVDQCAFVLCAGA